MALTGSALRVELAECVRLGRLRRHAERVRAAAQAASHEIEPDALFGRTWTELDRA